MQALDYLVLQILNRHSTGRKHGEQQQLWDCRHTSEDIKDVERKLGVGDRLEFNRGLYAHWGMYVGRFQGMRHAVVHFGVFEKGLECPKKKKSGRAFAASQKPEIRADTIGKILGGSGEVRINNTRDNEVEPLRPNDIIEKTKSNLRDKTPTAYNLYGNNCEHFVNRCRYGTPHSEQLCSPG
ncbi:phospholipase A and acyltransferase 2-like [Patiria miniata]|uniref:LRAT domain-containing protein n=1 Tax=Patiria miniata TaxID=46514 RepID=A0A914AF30_PATMI|nr:phospholipase A and acyltransferase 2-like [Patiria miniata]